jgi:uncharacterized protein (DUF1697 family)
LGTQRYIALLRAINVGGHTVKMDVLRGLFREMGFRAVETFIASGNVIFEADAGDEKELAQRIEAHLKSALGYGVATFLRTPTEISAAAEHEPFPSLPEGSSFYVAFLAKPPTEEAVEKLMALRTPIDDFSVRGREVYWLCRTRSSDSTFSGALLEKTLGMSSTLRNITTVRKLAARYSNK